jgi:two-component system, NtrC family, response regulator AtoC
MARDNNVGQKLQLLVLVGEESRELDLPSEGALSIGRGEECSIVINEPSVSRNHALLHLGPKLVIEDLGSANGTMIRDRAVAAASTDTMSIRHLVARKAELSVGDMLLFGSARAVVRYAPAAEVSELCTLEEDIVVRDPAMRELHAQAALAASAPINVLLLGETGVGKEVLAHAIHSRSTRAKKPFLAINCAALSDSLLESELFGHEKGAFTGAVQARAGLFEAAAAGTVLLDEVGELAPSVQAKLLRVIEQRVVMRLGSSRPRAVDVRVIAATNRDLEADVRDGRFRQDLYFRLNGLSLWIPPLRERPLEIEHLARSFLAIACRLIDRTEVPRISRDTLECLACYGWPGNVRELRHAMERAAILCRGGSVTVEHLPEPIAKGQKPARPKASDSIETASPLLESGILGESSDLPCEIRSLERARILEALERSQGSQSAAARLLGISRRTLISRIEDYGLPRPRRRTTSSGA